MTGNEDIKVGDQLVCISNEGLMTEGKIHTVHGINEYSINVSGCDTAWTSRSNFRWHCYKLVEEVSYESNI